MAVSFVTPGDSHPIRFFIDSADRAAAEPWLKTGMFSGVTTNPQLMREAGQKVWDIPEIYDWARDRGAREVLFQAWGTTPEELYRSAMQIREAAPGSTIKVPVTPTGAELISRLRDQDIPVLMTAVRAGRLGAIDWGAVQAGVMVMTIPCLVIFLALQRYYTKGLIGGSIK